MLFQEIVLRELWVPLSGAIATQRQIDVVANNIANVNTVGFKKDDVTFKEHLTALEKGHNDIDLPNKEWKPEDFYKSYGAEHSFVKADATYSDLSQGRLAPTGNSFDFAIQGPGFFEILTANGVRYTRNGSFSIQRDGKLVTTNGLPVLTKLLPKLEKKPEVDVAETEIPTPDKRIVNIGNGKFQVSLDGSFYVDGNKAGELSVVEFHDPNALRKEGALGYINNDEKNIKTVDVKSSVHQGFVEESNVNSVVEMSNLIKANRNFESIQRVIKTYDSIAGQGVNEISKF